MSYSLQIREELGLVNVYHDPKENYFFLWSKEHSCYFKPFRFIRLRNATFIPNKKDTVIDSLHIVGTFEPDVQQAATNVFKGTIKHPALIFPIHGSNSTLELGDGFYSYSYPGDGKREILQLLRAQGIELSLGQTNSQILGQVQIDAWGVVHRKAKEWGE